MAKSQATIATLERIESLSDRAFRLRIQGRTERAREVQILLRAEERSLQRLAGVPVRCVDFSEASDDAMAN